MSKVSLAMWCVLWAGCGEVVTEHPDATPTVPTVVSISPTDQATGVAADASIVITFSQRMDPAATQAAFQCPDLPSSAATMTWSSDGTVLTIKPNAPLMIASGTDPSMVTAKTYSITVTTGAASSSGAHLATAFTSSFRTLRRIQQTLPFKTALSGVCYGGGSGNRLIAGDAANNTAYRGLVTFDITGLPDGVRTFDSAKLALSYDGADGAPLALGPYVIEQITFDAMANACAAASRRSLGTLPIASVTDVGVKMIDVQPGVADDYMQRLTVGNKTQYRISSTTVTNNNSTGDFFHFDTQPIAQLLLDYTVD